MMKHPMLKLFLFISTALSVSPFILGDVVDESGPMGFLSGTCGLVSADFSATNEFLLSESAGGTNTTITDAVNCVSLPFVEGGENSEIDIDGATMLKVTIVPDKVGRYSFMHPFPGSENPMSGMGYSLTAPSVGLHYRVESGTNLTFHEFVEGSTITVSVQVVARGNCVSETVDYIPGKGDDDSHAVVWDSRGYYLSADYFSYTVSGEETVYFEGDDYLSGSRNGNESTIMEVNWTKDGREKGFYAVIQGHPEPPDYTSNFAWTMMEVSVLNNNHEWVPFYLKSDQQIEGTRDICFQKKSLVLSSFDENNLLHQIHFYNLTFMPFVPWYNDCANQTAMDICKAQPVPQDLALDTELFDTFYDSELPSVHWIQPHYLLNALYFEWTFAGEEPSTMEGSIDIEMGGDSRGDNEMTIEITWLNGTDGWMQSFQASFEANSTHWNMYETKLIGSDELWDSFENLTGAVSGQLGSCFYQDSLIISNGRGSEIRFEEITLAVFLPWDDEAQIEDSLPALESRSFADGVSDSCDSYLDLHSIMLHGMDGEEEGLNYEEEDLRNVTNVRTVEDEDREVDATMQGVSQSQSRFEFSHMAGILLLLIGMTLV